MPARFPRQPSSSDRQVADHRVVAEDVPRGGVVNARRPGRRTGRSGAESIDDAEHGASIKNAMVRRVDPVCNRDDSAGSTLEAPEEISAAVREPYVSCESRL
jgi:hypothetical protein